MLVFGCVHNNMDNSIYAAILFFRYLKSGLETKTNASKSIE